MSDPADNSKGVRLRERVWQELRDRLDLPVILFLDALSIAVFELSEAGLHWLDSLPFLREVITDFGKAPNTVGFVQFVVVVGFCTTHLLVSGWQAIFRAHGGPKPNFGVAIVVTCVLYFGVAKLDSGYATESPQPAAAEEVAAVAPQATFGAEDGPDQARLPATFRLQGATRGTSQPQQFVVESDVTEVEVQTAVAYAKFETFRLVLDGKKLQGYQIRNGHLSFMVDRQTLWAGKHSLAVRILRRGKSKADVLLFEFMIVDAPRWTLP
jgi:hypothetical protein